jgi:hypothetical protein
LPLLGAVVGRDAAGAVCGGGQQRGDRPAGVGCAGGLDEQGQDRAVVRAAGLADGLDALDPAAAPVVPPGSLRISTA